MQYRLIITLIVAMFTFSGCSIEQSPLSLLNHKTTVPTEELNEMLAKAFPIKKKSSFGSIVFKRAMVKPSSKSDRLKISVLFGLTSFEIPEGIDGDLSILAGLRYDPKTKKIFLTEVTPVSTHFSSPSLAEYVSREVRSALKMIAMQELSEIEIYEMSKSFKARFIKSVFVEKGNIAIKYGI